MTRRGLALAIGLVMLGVGVVAGCGPVYLAGDTPDTSYADSYGKVYGRRYGGYYGGYYGNAGWYDPYYNRPYCGACGGASRPPHHRPPSARPPMDRPPAARPPSMPSRPRPVHRR